MTIILTTPVGRIVQGDLWKPNKVLDTAGNPKRGRDGQEMTQHYFALAIAKQPGHTHWSQTDWGGAIWTEGHRAHPMFAPHPTFSWKVEDGDSAIPNKKGKKNCDREGFPGHWILKFRSGFLPKTYNADGSAPLPAEQFKCGYYVQVNLSCSGNTGDSPGVYLNPNMVALAGYGPEIVSGPDAGEAGFGDAPLPAGASPVPIGGFVPPATPAASVPPPTASAPLPNPAILMPPPVTAPAHVLTAKAQGATYEGLIAAGWNDALLVQHGMMLP